MILVLSVLTAFIVLYALFREGILEALGALICCLIVSFVIYIICVLEITTSSPFVRVGEVKTSITSLKTGNSVSGSFFLGSGIIDSYDYYIFMKDLGDNQYIRDKVTTTNTILRETDHEKPNLKYVRYVRYHKKTFWFPEMYGEYVSKDYVLTVPSGTVIEKFQAN